MKLNKKIIGEFLKNTGLGLVREGLQTLPVVGTLITNYKSTLTPRGKIALSKWDWYRIAVGLVIGFVLVKGLLTIDQIKMVLHLVGF